MSDLMEFVNECRPAKAVDAKSKNLLEENLELLQFCGFRDLEQNLKEKHARILKLAAIAAEGYIEITPDQIRAFLGRKANAYNCRILEARKKKPSKRERSIIDETLNLAFTNWANGIQQSQFDTQNQLIANLQNMQRTTTTPSFPSTQWTDATNSWFNTLISRSYREPTVDHMSADKDSIGVFEWVEVPVKNYKGLPPKEVLLKFKETKEKDLFQEFTIASIRGIRDPLLLGRLKGWEPAYFIAQWGDDVCLDDVI